MYISTYFLPPPPSPSLPTFFVSLFHPLFLLYLNSFYAIPFSFTLFISTISTLLPPVHPLPPLPSRYDLQFSVSDRAWRQRGVAANVTVAVRLLTPEALTHAAPLALTPTTPADLTRGWSPSVCSFTVFFVSWPDCCCCCCSITSLVLCYTCSVTAIFCLSHHQTSPRIHHPSHRYMPSSNSTTI